MTKTRFSDTTRLNMVDAIECQCDGRFGLTYQSCRFCGAGWPKERRLWKYGVRHYACDSCRTAALAEEDAIRGRMNAHIQSIAGSPPIR